MALNDVYCSDVPLRNYSLTAAATAVHLSGYFHTNFGNKVLVFSYVLDVILFLDIVVSLRTAIVTPHGMSVLIVIIVRNVSSRPIVPHAC